MDLVLVFLLELGNKLFQVVTSGISGVISELGASSAAWKTFNGNMEMLGKSSNEIISTKKRTTKICKHKQSIVLVIWLLLTVSWQQLEQRIVHS